jgi:hypothetical protein
MRAAFEKRHLNYRQSKRKKVISLDVEDLWCSLVIMTLCGPVRSYLRFEVHTAPFVTVKMEMAAVNSSNNLVNTYFTTWPWNSEDIMSR